MPQAKQTLILIPARMASTRLPDKPMALIDGIPMICQVYDRALEAKIGIPWVATDSQEIFDAVEAHGGKAVMTRSDHGSGSDRIWEALVKVDPGGEAEYVINLQGDLPTIGGDLIRQSLRPLTDRSPEEGGADIATLAVEITDEAEKSDPNVVKIIGKSFKGDQMRAITFTRAAAPWGEGPLYHHIGLYAYRRSALEKFVSLAPSPLELRERLEQLRAIENDMTIDVTIVDTFPMGVDTPEDLERACQWFANSNQK